MTSKKIVPQNTPNSNLQPAERAPQFVITFDYNMRRCAACGLSPSEECQTIGAILKDGTGAEYAICRECFSKGPAYFADQLRKLAAKVKTIPPSVWEAGNEYELCRAILINKLNTFGFLWDKLRALDLAELEKINALLPEYLDIPF